MREKISFGGHAAFFTLVALTLLMCITVCASALTVPAVTVDSSILTVKDNARAVVTGSVSAAMGQKVVLIADDGTTVLNEATLSDAGGPAQFSLTMKDYSSKKST